MLSLPNKEKLLMTRIRRNRSEPEAKTTHGSITGRIPHREPHIEEVERVRSRSPNNYSPTQRGQPQFEVEEIDQKLSTGKLTVKFDRKNRYYWFFLGKIGIAFARAQIDASHHSTYILSINGQAAEAKQFDKLDALHDYLIEELQS